MRIARQGSSRSRSDRAPQTFMLRHFNMEVGTLTNTAASGFTQYPQPFTQGLDFVEQLQGQCRTRQIEAKIPLQAQGHRARSPAGKPVAQWRQGFKSQSGRAAGARTPS